MGRTYARNKKGQFASTGGGGGKRGGKKASPTGFESLSTSALKKQIRSFNKRYKNKAGLDRPFGGSGQLRPRRG